MASIKELNVKHSGHPERFTLNENISLYAKRTGCPKLKKLSSVLKYPFKIIYFENFLNLKKPLFFK